MKYIKGFDSLRALSILLVLSAHLGLYHYLPENDFIKQKLWKIISGGIGVQVFFTLSGFLITTILLKEKEIKKQINFKNFYIRRFLRLLPPLIIFYIIIAFLMVFNQIESTAFGFLFSFFYVYNFVPTQYYTSELGHTWSLALEEQFYFIWPFLISYIQKKLSFTIIISIIILSCVLSYYLIPGLASSRNSRWFIPASVPIMVGSYIAILNYYNKIKWQKIFLKNISLLLFSVICFLFPIYAPDVILRFVIVIQPLGVALFLVWILYNQESRITILLDNKILSYIGKISYGLYVYQGLFLGTGPGGNLIVQQFPLNIGLTIIVAILSYEFIEKPILTLKSRFK